MMALKIHFSRKGHDLLSWRLMVNQLFGISPQDTTGQAVDTDQGAGLPTASMKVACAPSSTTGICVLGSAFVFTQGSYPKIKKCTSGCDTGSPVLSNDLVIGQD